MITAERIPHVPRPARISAFVAARLGGAVIDPVVVNEVLDRYGLRLSGASRNLRLARRSRNVVVTTDEGKKVVKLYRPQWSPDTVRYVHSILERLEDLGFPAPVPERTLDGDSWTQMGGEVYAVFDFLPGINYSLDFLLRDDRLHLTAVSGRTLARLHRELQGFKPQGAHHLGFESYSGPRRRDLAWHARKLEELTARSQHLEGEDRALSIDLIAQTEHLFGEIQRLDGALSDAEFPRLVIHGDYGLHNLLFESRDRAIPVDYELSRLDWRLNDLISALVKYRYSGGDYDFESMKVFARAYADGFPLEASEERLLPEAWRFYKLQAAVQYWNSYFETGGPLRKLASALDSLGQARWVAENTGLIGDLIDARVPTQGSGRRRSERGAARELTVMEVTPDLEVGGAQETVRTVAKYLPRVGCPTLVCTFKEGPLREELEREGVLVERLPTRHHSILSGPPFLVEMFRRRRDLLGLIEKHDVDVIQTQGLGTLDFLVMTLRFGSNVQVWWTIQNARFMVRAEHLPRFRSLLAFKQAAHRWLYRLGMRLVDGVIVVSDETKDSFRDVIGRDGNVEVVFNAVDVERYPVTRNRSLARSRLGFGPTDHVMTMVGTFKRQKGHRYLIDAIGAVGDRFPHLHLLLVGDGEFLEEVREQARHSRIQDRVHFLGTRRDIAGLLGASDSFVLPSLWEGLPVALVEAMATGLPTVATNVSGTSQVMVDGETGWLVPPGDAPALAAGIIDLLEDPERASRMGAMARKRVEARFSGSAQATHLAALFRKRIRA